MIHLCSLRLTRLPSASSLPAVGRAAPHGYSIFILTILRILTTDTLRAIYSRIIAVTRLAGDILLTEQLPPLFSPVHLHLFLVLKVEFMDIAVLTSNGYRYLRFTHRLICVRAFSISFLYEGHYMLVIGSRLALLVNHVIDGFVSLIVRIFCNKISRNLIVLRK